MTERTEIVDHYSGLFEQERERLPGSDVAWVTERRQAAMNRFAETGLPAPRDEEWKYTSLRPLEKRQFGLPATEAPGLRPEEIAEYVFDDPETVRLVFVDGVYSPALSRTAPLPEGVVVQPMSAALAEPSEALQRNLGRYADPEGTAFVALNTALMGDGVYVHVPAGTTVDTPIHALFLTSPGAEGVGPHYRNLVVAEEGASVTVLEDFVGLGDGAYFNNTVTEAVAPAQARVEIYKLQQEGPGGYHVATFEGYQGENSVLTHHNIALGGRLVRNDINDALDAEGALVNLNGLYLGDGREHVDNHTRIDHLKPNAESREYYKGILDGRARGVFNGKVVVQPEAQGTESDQQNRNLLLSRNTEVDPKPELEIFADDVSCTHGATVGQLDEDALFFLRSRGIGYEDARNLLIFGFANEIIERVRIEPVRARLEERLLKRLPHTEAMED
ncbi:Fe-S cluster assembly protein SufD [Thiohalorhabdus methylotrophus]|uniref:Fe-S cluster assembly protein SufD n=1 Tax=Thiohalorhabdus methylotrophus TaxID=3242694 RepID=A0ABV4TYL4_9GAMM